MLPGRWSFYNGAGSFKAACGRRPDRGVLPCMRQREDKYHVPTETVPLPVSWCLSDGGMNLRRLLIGLLFMVAAGSAGFAQNGNYVGASTGVPLAVNFHCGFVDVFVANTDVRVIARLQFINAFGLSAVADVIHYFRTDSLSAPYAGGGLAAGFATASSGGTT